jgi:hypothetical protein
VGRAARAPAKCHRVGILCLSQRLRCAGWHLPELVRARLRRRPVRRRKRRCRSGERRHPCGRGLGTGARNAWEWDGGCERRHFPLDPIRQMR